MRRPRRSSAKNGRVTLSEARRAARAVKAGRKKGHFVISDRDRERLLGHFGPPVHGKRSKKRSASRKSAKKRAA